MPAPDKNGSQTANRDDLPTPARFVAGGPVHGQGRSIVFALIATVVLHVGGVLVMPDELTKKTTSFEARTENRLEVILEEPEPPPEEFILTNPDVPANPPDETHFFSNREQQAAQEEETDEGDPSLPSIDGEEPEPNQNIVSNESFLSPLDEEVVRGRTDAEGGEGGESATTVDSLPERLIPGFEPTEEEEGLEVPVTPDAETDLEEDPVIGVNLGAEDEARQTVEEGQPSETEGEEGATPRPRPSLSQLSRGPIGARAGSAPRVGHVAVDANFSEYGDYLARMLDVIVRQWHILAWDALQPGEVGTVVAVSFRVDSAGTIHGLEVLTSTASLVATLICQDAIASRQPYGDWTPDMMEVLGEEQTVQIRFHYR